MGRHRLRNRYGDTQIGHLTPGEMVVPASPDFAGVRGQVARALAAAGINPGRMTVGGPDDTRSPVTGFREFFDPEGAGGGTEGSTSGGADPGSGGPGGAAPGGGGPTGIGGGDPSVGGPPGSIGDSGIGIDPLVDPHPTVGTPQFGRVMQAIGATPNPATGLGPGPVGTTLAESLANNLSAAMGPLSDVGAPAPASAAPTTTTISAVPAAMLSEAIGIGLPGIGIGPAVGMGLNAALGRGAGTSLGAGTDAVTAAMAAGNLGRNPGTQTAVQAAAPSSPVPSISTVTPNVPAAPPPVGPSFKGAQPAAPLSAAQQAAIDAVGARTGPMPPGGMISPAQAAMMAAMGPLSDVMMGVPGFGVDTGFGAGPPSTDTAAVGLDTPSLSVGGVTLSTTLGKATPAIAGGFGISPEALGFGLSALGLNDNMTLSEAIQSLAERGVQTGVDMTNESPPPGTASQRGIQGLMDAIRGLIE